MIERLHFKPSDSETIVITIRKKYIYISEDSITGKPIYHNWAGDWERIYKKDIRTLKFTKKDRTSLIQHTLQGSRLCRYILNCL